MYQNYIFDLYGTLVDIQTDEEAPEFWESIAQCAKDCGAEYEPLALRKSYRNLVREQEKMLAKQTGRNVETVEIKLEDVFYALFCDKGAKLTKKQLLQFALTFRKLSTDEISLFPKVIDLLTRLKTKGKKVYLLSNAQRIFTMPEMKQLGIYDFFDGILYSSDAGIKKPSTEFYQMLFDQYQLKKEESVMIGNDCIADISSAHAFGIDSMYIHTRQSSPLILPLPDNTKMLYSIDEVEGEII